MLDGQAIGDGTLADGKSAGALSLGKGRKRESTKQDDSNHEFEEH